MADNRDIDHHSGVETTGHEWDGIRELNNPLPRWWVLVFYATIIWAIAYWVVFPSWPLLPGADRSADYVKGIWGLSERAAVNAAVAADKAAQSKFTDLIAKESVTEINSNPELLKFSMTAGRAAFLNNCAGCHGSGAQGNPGYPNLNDDNWLWGGTLDQIDQTILNGVRNGSEQARGGGSTAGMPERASVLKPDQINDVAEYVLSLSKHSTDAAAAERGKAIFSGDGGCNACHGDDAKGNQELGSVNLTAGIFQWGGSKADVVKTITEGRAGVMPAWTGKLEPATIKELAVYVHSLGGGQ
ncbi:MAG: cytochrome-c oxidase, cbb3-type subunit III [Rhodomicrobium sp.]